MTKAPLGGEKTGRNPTDRAKSGTKRSLLMEMNGIPIGLSVEGANCHDKKMIDSGKVIISNGENLKISFNKRAIKMANLRYCRKGDRISGYFTRFSNMSIALGCQMGIFILIKLDSASLGPMGWEKRYVIFIYGGWIQPRGRLTYFNKMAKDLFHLLRIGNEGNGKINIPERDGLARKLLSPTPDISRFPEIAQVIGGIQLDDTLSARFPFIKIF